jgi:hypothetical protein
MRISTNNNGNYAPGYTHEVKAKPRAKSEFSLNAAGTDAPVKSEKINNEEKNFFINLYPDNKKEIADYHFYQKSGKMSGVAVGSLFDRRG